MRRRLVAGMGVLIGALIGTMAAAPAVAQDPQDKITPAVRDADRIGTDIDTSRQAGAGERLEGADVAFDAVLKDPDNIVLNFAYAKTLIRRGNLGAAAPVLQRILLVAPAMAQVRLVYAVVLYRLEDLINAETELKLLQKAKLPDKLRAEVNFYIHRIKLRRQALRQSVTVSMGGVYDWNRNAVSDSNSVLLFDNHFPLTTGRRTSDESLITVVDYRFVYDPGNDPQHELFGGFRHFHSFQSQLVELNIHNIEADLGGTYRTRAADISPSVFYSRLFINEDETFLETAGINVLVARQVRKNLEVNGNLRFERENFTVTSLDTQAELREGNRFRADVGAQYALTPTQRIGAKAIFEHKNASRKKFTYFRSGVEARHTWLLGRGQFVVTSAGLSFDRYDDADPIVSVRTRQDTNMRLGISYGTPLGTLAGFVSEKATLPPQLADMLLTVAGEWRRRASNLTNFQTTNWRGQLLLTKRWDF